MNVFDNEVVLEYLQGSVLFRDIVFGTNKIQILYAGANPNGVLFAEPGSVAFGPSGSWENISVLVVPDTQGAVWQLIGTGVTLGDGFLAPNEFWVDPTFVVPGPTGREVTTIEAAIALADTLALGSIVIRLREGQDHVWAASLIGSARDITITAVGQAFARGIDAAVAGRIRIGGAGLSLLANTGVQRNLEIRDFAVRGDMLVHEGWNLTLREAVTDGLAITVDQGGAGATNPVRILLEDTTGDNTRYANNLSPLTVQTTNYSGALATTTIVRANRCALQGVVTDTGERFMDLGNSFALFDGCTFNVKSISDVFGLWIGAGAVPGPTNGTFIEFVASSLIGDFTGIGFVRPLFSLGPTVRFTGLTTIDIVDEFTGAPTPTWSWASGAWNPQGYPVLGNARPPKMQVPGASLTDETVNTVDSGRGAVTERVASGLGFTVTGGRFVYGQVMIGPYSGAGDLAVAIPFFSQSVDSEGPLLALPLFDDRVYVFTAQAVFRTSPIGAPPPLVGWASGRIDGTIRVTGGVASFVPALPGYVGDLGSDPGFFVLASIVSGELVFFARLGPPALAGSSAEVELELSILAV
jgi:hypothetical protein